MHFQREEFHCNCGNCHCDTVDYELMELLERLREYYGRPVIITSGHRCLEYNRKIGSSDGSQHVQGRAADLYVRGVSPCRVYETLCEWYPNSHGFGNYKDFTHVDTRETPARW